MTAMSSNQPTVPLPSMPYTWPTQPPMPQLFHPPPTKCVVAPPYLIKTHANHLYCASCGCDVDHSSPHCPSKRIGHDDTIIHKEIAKQIRDHNPALKMPCLVGYRKLYWPLSSTAQWRVEHDVIPTLNQYTSVQTPPTPTPHQINMTSHPPTSSPVVDDITVVASNTSAAVRQRRLQRDLNDLPPYKDLFISLPSTTSEHICNAAGTITIPDGWGLFDSGATSLYLTPSDAKKHCRDLRPATTPIHVTIPDGTQQTSTHTCRLDWPDLPTDVTYGHILPGLAHFSLVPVNTFARAGCRIVFDDTAVKIFYRNKCIVRGVRHTQTGLWIIPLSHHVASNTAATLPPQSRSHQASNAYTIPTKQQAVSYMHQSVGNPPIQTLLKASLRGALDTFPHLTPSNIRKHLAPSPATAKGHMRRQRQHLRPTTPSSSSSVPSTTSDPPSNPTLPTQSPGTECNMFCLAVLADLHKGTIYNDNTGIFPVQSIDGHQLFFVTYVYDLNAILARPLKNQQSDTIVTMYQEVFNFLRSRGFTPKFNVCDNQASKMIKEFLAANQCDGQFVVPGDHRVLAAERAIQCWKNHFISVLCTTDAEFPLQLWPYLAPQAEDMLNVLRPSKDGKTQSAYEALYGEPYDFNRHPIAPAGTKTVLYEPADTRSSWGPRGIDGWYVGPAKDHYRAYQIYIPETKRIRIGNTVQFFPQHCRYRTFTVLQQAKEIINELQSILPKLKEAQRKLLLRKLSSTTKSSVQRVTTPESVQRVQMSTAPSTPVDTHPTSTPVETSTPVDTYPTSRTLVNQPQQRVSAPSSSSHYNTHSPSIGIGQAPPRYTPTGMSRRRLHGLVDHQLRLDSNGPPRISSSPPVPTSTNPTLPSVHKTAKRVHRRITRSNKPGVLPPVTSPNPPPLRRSPRLNPVLASITEDPPHVRVQTSNFITHHAINALTENVYYSSNATWTPTKLQRIQQTNPLPDLQHFAAPVVHPETGETITSYRKLAHDKLLGPTWQRGFGKEFGNLCQGDDLTGEVGTNALHVMSHADIANIPADRVVTYARIVVDYRPQKDDPNRVRITAGGNLITTPEDVTTRTADLVTTKILWNSVLSTPGAKYACFDIKSFFLTAPLTRYEYMKIPFDIFPPHTIEQYNLRDKVKDGFIYLECRRCIYGLPQSGALANQLLRQRLAPAGYFEVPHTPGLWKHVTRPIQFSLIVDDFGVKYVGEEHAQHLLKHLKHSYTVSEDWTGSLYAGITLDWDYEKRTLGISMPKYIPKLLQRYAHNKPARPQHSPHPAPPKKYGAEAQTPVPTDDSHLLPKERIRRIQAIVGSILFYARAIDNTVLVALSSIAMSQAKATENTENIVEQLLDYLATHPNASVLYRASDMILNIHSDASYLNEPNGRSRVAGFYFLGSSSLPGQPITMNGAIHVSCSVIRFTVASAAEAELGALFVNCREGKTIRLILEELGHPQPATPVHCDNATAAGIANDSIKKQRSRAMEMRFFWVTDQVQRKLFDVHWYPGKENLADYFTKHFTAKHHMAVRPYYLHMNSSPQYLPRAIAPRELRGCVGKLENGYVRTDPLPRILR